jgi:predicted nucleotidyltransferase
MHVKTDVTSEMISGVVRQIVDSFHPQKIVLFGSYAYGQPTPDSDVDLLVVMETSEQPLYTAARIAASIDHPFPLDILVLEPHNVQAALARNGVFVTEVMKKGVVLYEE